MTAKVQTAGDRFYGSAHARTFTQRAVPLALLCTIPLLLSSCAKKPDNSPRDAIPNLGMGNPREVFFEQDGDWAYVIVVDGEPADAIAFGTLCVATRKDRTYWTHDEIVVLRKQPTTIGIEKKLGTRHYSVSVRSPLPPASKEKWHAELLKYVDKEGLDKRFPRDLFTE